MNIFQNPKNKPETSKKTELKLKKMAKKWTKSVRKPHHLFGPGPQRGVCGTCPACRTERRLGFSFSYGNEEKVVGSVGF
jgi:7-cyano-7-deazaguanine synthase in queuosine biosynthesis